MFNHDKLSKSEIKELGLISTMVRMHVINMIANAKSGHPGGSLSAVDILVTLYGKCMRHYKEWSEHPEFEDRDRFVLSKGHASAALYAVLAEFEYFPVEELMTFRKFGTRLQGHPSYGYLPGVEVSSGSLGQGLSMACGMALGLKLDKKDSYVYCYCGDGEMQEGQIWEAIMGASQHKLDNLILFVDRNNLQIDGQVDNIKSLGDLKARFEAFDWAAMEINGHKYQEIFQAVSKAHKLGKKHKCPVAIICDTVKGKGVSFMENNPDWHGKAPKEEETERALQELRGDYNG